jgi:hypothetical protein
MTAPNICGSSEWSLLFIPFLAPRILRWLLGLWKILVSLIYPLACPTGKNYMGLDLVNYEATFPAYYFATEKMSVNSTKNLIKNNATVA